MLLQWQEDTELKLSRMNVTWFLLSEILFSRAISIVRLIKTTQNKEIIVGSEHESANELTVYYTVITY